MSFCSPSLEAGSSPWGHRRALLLCTIVGLILLVIPAIPSRAARSSATNPKHAGRVGNASTGRQEQQLRSSSPTVLFTSWSPRGDRLVSADADPPTTPAGTVVALAAVEVPEGLEDPAPLAARVEDAVERGGIYDPITGKGDDGKRAAVIEETRRRMGARYRATAFVTAGIFVRPARFSGENATWDGVSEKVTDIATWKKLLVTTRGTARGLSFGILIEDPDGTPLHVGWGGIQLADHLSRDRFERVSSERLFSDPERDRRAVDLSLDDWLTAREASSEGDRR